MYVYKDYNYVRYVWEEMPIEEALEVYEQANDQLLEERLWEMYLLEVQHGGYKGNFEEYKAKNKGLNQTRSMTPEQAKKIEENTKSTREKIRNANKKTVVNIKSLK